MIQKTYYLTYDEISAIERGARRAQAAVIVQLTSHAISTLIARTRQFAAALSRALDNPPAQAARRGASATLASIIEEMCASLPTQVRSRYANDLATAARVAPVIDLGLAALDFSARTLARVFQGAALGLRAGARAFDAVAWRLAPTH